MSEPTAEVLALAQTLSPGLFPIQDNERVGRRRDREVAYRLAERVLDSDWLRERDATITSMESAMTTRAGTKVTATDTVTGYSESTIIENNYVVIVDGDMYLSNTEIQEDGTTILTIKKRA